MGSCVHNSGQEDMSQSIDAEFVEIVLGEIQLEASSEVSDSRFQFVSPQSGNGRGLCLKTTPRTHPHNP